MFMTRCTRNGVAEIPENREFVADRVGLGGPLSSYLVDREPGRWFGDTGGGPRPLAMRPPLPSLEPSTGV